MKYLAQCAFACALLTTCVLFAGCPPVPPPQEDPEILGSWQRLNPEDTHQFEDEQIRFEEDEVYYFGSFGGPNDMLSDKDGGHFPLYPAFRGTYVVDESVEPHTIDFTWTNYWPDDHEDHGFEPFTQLAIWDTQFSGHGDHSHIYLWVNFGDGQTRPVNWEGEIKFERIAGHGGDHEPVAAEVYLRGSEDRLAYVHGDHWHGRIELEEGEEIEVDVRFLDSHGHVISLGGEFTVGASFATGQPTDVVDVEAHGDHLDIDGLRAGETRILLHFLHDDHIEWSTPALRVVVHEHSHGHEGEGEDHDHEPVGAEVFLRGTDQRLAYVHGDHWHGRIELEEGEEVEVDVRFLDDHGHVISLGGEFTVGASIAPGHPTGIVDVEAHGDHLDIDGLSVGETRILIHFLHDGHVEWTAPALRVVVHEHSHEHEGEGEDHHHEPVGAEVFLRGTDQRLAYVHGDHWHGRIELEEGQEVEVDVRFLDDHDNVLPLSGGFSVGAEIAPGHPSGIADVEAHGDHLDVEGLSPGETRILIHFLHDNHIEWSTPALRVIVHEHGHEGEGEDHGHGHGHNHNHK